MEHEGTQSGAAVDDTRPFDLAALRAAVLPARPPRPRLGPAVTPSALPPAPRSLPPVVVAPLPPVPPAPHRPSAVPDGAPGSGHASGLGPGIQFVGRPLPSHDGLPVADDVAGRPGPRRTALTVAVAAGAVVIVVGVWVTVALLAPLLG